MAFKTTEEIDQTGDKLSREHRLNLQCPPMKWTGWKYCGYDVMARKEDMVKDWDAGFVAQICWYKMRDAGTSTAEYGYYVNLPGMQSGKFVPGGTFEIGYDTMRADTPSKDIDAMIETGWQKLIALVKEEEGVDISEHRT